MRFYRSLVLLMSRAETLSTRLGPSASSYVSRFEITLGVIADVVKLNKDGWQLRALSLAIQWEQLCAHASLEWDGHLLTFPLTHRNEDWNLFEAVSLHTVSERDLDHLP